MIFLALFPVIHLAGQKLVETNFDFYSTASGMSHNYVSGIRQDFTGYMWIATSSGLNRFNGTRFVQFHSNTDTVSLNSFYNFFLDSNGYLIPERLFYLH